MFTPTLHITLPEDDGEARHFLPIALALKAMVEINTFHIRRAMKRFKEGTGMLVPPIYASGVRYRNDPPGQENWRDCYSVMAEGFGDCDNLVGWRVAELNAAGIPSEAKIKWQQIPKPLAIRLGLAPANMIPESGISMVHCVVQHPNGEIEDISKNLGMGGDYTNDL